MQSSQKAHLMNKSDHDKSAISQSGERNSAPEPGVENLPASHHYGNTSTFESNTESDPDLYKRRVSLRELQEKLILFFPKVK